MKGILILTLLVLGGCANQVSLEQLEDEALTSGDWSQVEKRERARSRVNLRSAQHCGDRLILFCEELGSSRACECVPSHVAAGKVLGP
jgi:hypothetical protein